MKLKITQAVINRRFNFQTGDIVDLKTFKFHKSLDPKQVASDLVASGYALPLNDDGSVNSALVEKLKTKKLEELAKVTESKAAEQLKAKVAKAKEWLDEQGLTVEDLGGELEADEETVTLEAYEMLEGTLEESRKNVEAFKERAEKAESDLKEATAAVEALTKEVERLDKIKAAPAAAGTDAKPVKAVKAKPGADAK